MTYPAWRRFYFFWYQKNSSAISNGKLETSFTKKPGAIKDVVSVAYETREGSAKFKRDFSYTSGVLVSWKTRYVMHVVVHKIF